MAGAFDYLDDSILAGVIRGVSNLSIRRIWVPPDRFRPLRLTLHFEAPFFLLPRDVRTAGTFLAL